MNEDDFALRMLPVEALVELVGQYKHTCEELQRRIDAYEGRLEEWEEIDRLIAASSLGGVEAQRVRDSVAPQVGKAIVRAMQEAERADRAEDERDRLREGMSAVFVELVGALQHDASSDIVESVRRLTAERDRLRAVVDAAWDYRRVLLREQVGEDWLKRTNDALEALFAALEQLDVSPAMGGDES